MMSWVTSRFYRVTAGVVALSMATGMVSPLHATARRTTIASRSYSDKQIFEGLVLSSGEVAEAIPELRDHFRLEAFTKDQRVLQAHRDFVSRLMRQITEKAPREVAALAHAARSGDPVVLASAFERAAGVRDSLMRAMPEVFDASRMLSDTASVTRMRANIRASLLNSGKSSVDAERLAGEAMRSLSTMRTNAAVSKSSVGTCAAVVFIAVGAVTIAIAVNYVFVAQIAFAYEATQGIGPADKDAAVAPNLLRERMIGHASVLLAS